MATGLNVDSNAATVNQAAAPPQCTMPSLPKRLPYFSLNMDVFDCGFAEEYVTGGLKDDVFACCICKGLPRHPATLETCGHLFCEGCIKRHYMFTKKPMVNYLTVQESACPKCRKPYRFADIATWEQVHLWSQFAYNTKEVTCPFGCGFKGSAQVVDDHQFYICPQRMIQCPNNGCSMVDVAQRLEREHFANCPFLRVYCSGCRLPVLGSERDKHNCMSAVHAALQGISANSIRVTSSSSFF